MLHLGIPEYRLPRDVLQAQVREILVLGPDLRLNSHLGDFSLEDLRAGSSHGVPGIPRGNADLPRKRLRRLSTKA